MLPLQVLISRQQKAAQLHVVQLELQQEAPVVTQKGASSGTAWQQETQLHKQDELLTIGAGQDDSSNCVGRSRPVRGNATGSGRLACLSLALPLNSRVELSGSGWQWQ